MSRAEEEPLRIGHALTRAVAELPEDWEIELLLTYAGSDVVLYGPDGGQHDYPSNHEWLSESIGDAVTYAREQAGVPVSADNA